MTHITIQSTPSRRGGCLATFFFLLFTIAAIALTNLWRIPELTLTTRTRTQIRHFEQFDHITDSPTHLHRKVFSVTGTVIWSAYFYFGGCYRIEDADGESLYIFTYRIPPAKDSLVDQQILFLEVISLLDTWRFYVIKEVKVKMVKGVKPKREVLTMQKM